MAMSTPAASDRGDGPEPGWQQSSRVQRLRDLLAGARILKGPCCHDGLSARLIEKSGFDFAFMSGFCTSASRLGAPDAGLLSYYEMVDQGRYVNEATTALPIIGDGDTGYGNAMNVKRTVRGYASAGFAGILIEDQVWPKSCGHVGGKQVVGREEAVARIRAAVDAREEGSDIVIVARTDARQAVSLEEAFSRAEAFAEAGADVLFIDALESAEEMSMFCGLQGALTGKPKMANMLEGGGKTPILPPEELEAMGFKLVAYPMSLLAVSVQAMELALEGLRNGRIPSDSAMPSFTELQAVVGFPGYFQEAGRYATGDAVQPSSPAVKAATGEGATEGIPSEGGKEQPAAEGAQVEVEVLSTQDPERPRPTQSAKAEASGDRLLLSVEGGGRGEQRSARFFRVRIADKRTDMVKLETRIPALFMDNLERVVPQVGGVDLQQLVQMAKQDPGWDRLQPIAEFDSNGDVIQIWLE